MSEKLSNRYRLFMGLFLALGVPVGLTIAYLFQPTEASFYPRCVFHLLTGLHCPGCGMTRALHAILHGEWRQAVAYNLFFLLILPILVAYGMRWGIEVVLGKSLPIWRWPAWATWTLLGVYLMFGVARNVPAEPFSSLAPHDLAPAAIAEEQR